MRLASAYFTIEDEWMPETRHVAVSRPVLGHMGRVFPVLNGAASLGTALELVDVFDAKVLAKLAG
jgi:hypothetical protein